MTYPFVVGPIAGNESDLPDMFAVRQQFDVLPAVDLGAALAAEWPRANGVPVRARPRRGGRSGCREPRHRRHR